jgi:hypothetical protein
MVFHDLRHTLVTMRRAGVDYFLIMRITGYEPMSAFKRHHPIDHQELPQAVGQLDTHMDTSAAADENPSHKLLKHQRAPVAQADRARDS